MTRRAAIHSLILITFITSLFAAQLATAFGLPFHGVAAAQTSDNGYHTFIPTPLTEPATMPGVAEDGTDTVDAVAAGSALTLEQLRAPTTLDPAQPFVIEATWRHTGVEQFPGSWQVVYLLRSDDGAAGWQGVSAIDLSTLEPAAAGAFVTLTDTLSLDNQLAPGNYTLGVVVRSTEDLDQTLPLPMAGVLSDGSYDLGTLEVGAPLAPALAETQSQPEIQASNAGQRIYLPLIGAGGERPGPSLSLEGARGYLTSPEELAVIKRKAAQGTQPYAGNVREFLRHQSISSPTAWVGQGSLDGSPPCSDGSQRDSSGRTLPRGPMYLIDGSRLAYAKMLAAHLSDGSRAEAYARETRRRILDLTDTHSWGGRNYGGDNQCILYLSWYVTGFIMAADLLESYPAIWTSTDKRNFQRWLATEVYHKAAWASRARTNNWGSGGSYAAAMIADYLHDSGLTLQEISPERRTLSPGEAYYEHTREQLSRMSAEVAPRDRKDARCLPHKGILPGGGIPDELRRSSTNLCDAKYLPSSGGSYRSAFTYQITHVEALIAHAELALRRGDSSLYDNIAADGSGSILRAIKFIIANPANPSASHDWDEYRKAQLYVAYRYYRDPAIERRLNGDTMRGGEVVIYGRLTHAGAPNESFVLPPAVEPPSR